MRANVIATLKDSIAELVSLQSEVSNPQIHFQDGRFEEWDTDIGQVKKDLQKEIDKENGWLKELLDAEQNITSVD